MTKTALKTDETASANDSPKSGVVLALQTQLANSFLMYLNYKHYHWQTFGPLFRDLHHLFDEFSAEVLESNDELAERIRMIGQNPVAAIAEITNQATVTQAAKVQNMKEMAAEANQNCLVIIKEMRAGIETANKHGDPGTADLLTRYVQVYEKQEWFLRQLLEKNDGLTR